MQAFHALPCPFTGKSLDQLEDSLVSLSSHINSSEYEFLVLLREFDIRQGWKPYHFNNCAEWLNFRCGIAMGTAREKVRISRALFDLPQTSAAFQKGELSYSKARAMTRIANPSTEERILEYALRATAQQVDNHCRQLRNVQREVSTADANRAHEQRYLSRSIHADGSMTISVELPRESGELVMKALELATAQLQTSDDESAVLVEDMGDEEAINRVNKVNLQRQQADALVQMARGYLGGGEQASSTADHYQVMVHVDEKALRGEAATCTCDKPVKSDLPIETIRRLTCDAGVVVVTEDEQGNPLNVGRKHRMVQPALRRALASRDKSCRYPGCTHEKWLDAHHVMHWADGGETSLSNTILLCSRHHRLLHEGGFRINKNPSGDWQFARG